MIKKKFWLPMIMIFFLMFLVGWGKKKIELLNDKKLIDLNAAIGICMPGADAPDHNPNPNDKEQEGKVSQELQTDSAGNEQRTIVIRIRGQKVIYDSAQLTSLDSLKDRIRQDYHDKVLFRVKEDFAEAHVYKDILKILSELESETGLTYTIE